MSYSHGNQSQSHYQYQTMAQAQPTQYYYPVPQQARTSYENPNMRGIPPRPSTYPQPGNSPPAEGERAAKRRRPVSMDRPGQSQAQWSAVYSQGHGQEYNHQHTLHPMSSPADSRRSPSSTHSRHGSNEPEEDDTFEHGPTELPPRTYSGHSRYNPPKKPGKIPGSAMDYLPILEARFERLETAIDRYVDYRAQRALSNSILPGHKGSSSKTTSGSSSR